MRVIFKISERSFKHNSMGVWIFISNKKSPRNDCFKFSHVSESKMNDICLVLKTRPYIRSDQIKTTSTTIATTRTSTKKNRTTKTMTTYVQLSYNYHISTFWEKNWDKGHHNIATTISMIVQILCKHILKNCSAWASFSLQSKSWT